MSEALEYGDEYVDPREIYDYVKNSSDPVSDLDLYKTFRVSLREMLRALGERSCTNPVFYRRASSIDYLFSSEQVDESWKLLRPMEHEYQYDDGGREASGIADMNGDCVIRALAIAARCGDSAADSTNGDPYRRVYQQLSEIVAEIAVQEFQYDLKCSEGVSESIYGRWLEVRGWRRLDRQSVIGLVGGDGRPTVWEFINEVKINWDEPVILSTQSGGEGHLVTVVDKRILDEGDCSDHLVEAAWTKAT